MSTRSLIGKELEGGKVEYIYCHWDGYPEHNGVVLKDNYNLENVDEILKLGSLSLLDETIEKCVFYARDMSRDFEKSEIIDIKEYFSEQDIMWTEYRYLFCLDGSLVYYNLDDIIEL